MANSCPKCNRAVSQGKPICMYCGAQVIALVPCPHCQLKIPPTLSVCQYCKKVVDAPAAPPPAASAVPLSPAAQEAAASGRRSSTGPTGAQQQEWYEEGLRRAEAGLHEEAVAAYDKALALNRFHAFALSYKVEALKKLGRGEEATACIAASLTSAVQGLQTAEAATQAQVAEVRRAGALLEGLAVTTIADMAHAGRRSTSTPADPLTLEMLKKGMAHSDAKQWTDATASVVAAVTRDPFEVRAWIAFASCFLALGAPQQALRASEVALCIAPRDEKVREFREIVLREQPRS